MYRKTLLAAATAAASVLAGAGARAGVLFDNLGATPVGSEAASIGLGQSFLTGASAVTQEKVVIDLTGASNFVQLGLYGDAGHAPDTSSLPLALDVFKATSGLNTVTFSASLAANTRYWVHLTGFSGPAWVIGGGLGPHVATEYSWDATNGSVFDGDVGGSFMMRVSDGVPEPATWTALILGAGLLGAAARRRRRAVPAA